MYTAPKTTKEGNAFYAILTMRSGHTYHIGPFNSRSAAKRAWIRATKEKSHEL
jgi:hypothetical protein